MKTFKEFVTESDLKDKRGASIEVGDKVTIVQPGNADDFSEAEIIGTFGFNGVEVKVVQNGHKYKLDRKQVEKI